MHRATRQRAGKARRVAGNWRPHGGAPAGNRKDRRLLAAQKAAKEISGDDSGSAAVAVAGPEESGLSVVELQGGHRGGRGKAGERRKTSRLAGLWRKERTKYFESSGSVQEIQRTISHQYRRRRRKRNRCAH